MMYQQYCSLQENQSQQIIKQSLKQQSIVEEDERLEESDTLLHDNLPFKEITHQRNQSEATEKTFEPPSRIEMSKFEEETVKIKREKSFLLCFGKNKNGELGIGSLKNLYEPLQIKNTTLPVQISSGGHHSALINEKGELFLCGSQLHGKLSLNTSQMNVTKWQKVEFKEETFVKKVACGEYHTLCLTKKGEVWQWGGSMNKKITQKN